MIFLLLEKSALAASGCTPSLRSLPWIPPKIKKEERKKIK